MWAFNYCHQLYFLTIYYYYTKSSTGIYITRFISLDLIVAWICFYTLADVWLDEILILINSKSAVIIESWCTVFDCNWRKWFFSSKTCLCCVKLDLIRNFRYQFLLFTILNLKLCFDKCAYHILSLSQVFSEVTH